MFWCCSKKEKKPPQTGIDRQTYLKIEVAEGLGDIEAPKRELEEEKKLEPGDVVLGAPAGPGLGPPQNEPHIKTVTFAPDT